jgi:hypothetical protein
VNVAALLVDSKTAWSLIGLLSFRVEVTPAAGEAADSGLDRVSHSSVKLNIEFRGLG